MSEIVFRDVHNNKYSKRVFAESPYRAKEIWNSLDWEQAHHKWRQDRELWECDLEALPYVMQAFREEGYSLETTDEVENVYEEQTGFELYPEQVDLHVSTLEGAELKVTQQGEEFTITQPGDYQVDKGSRLQSRVIAQGDHEVELDMHMGSTEDYIELIADNKYVRVNPADVDEGIDNLLDSELSYRVEGAEHINSVQRGAWDGREHLYDVHNHEAPVGLLRRAKTVLEEHGHDVKVRDKREGPELGDMDYDWNFEHDLRDYQVDAVQQALSTEGGTLNLPTGGGKTICALRLTKELGHKAIVLVHKTDLLYQWKDEIENILGKEAGVIGDDVWEEKDITVAMMQTLQERGLDLLQNDYEILVGDECHHVPADTFFEVSSGIDAYYKFGLTATPFRNDNADMKIFAGVGDITVKLTAEELIDDGYLARPEFETIEWEPSGFVPSDYSEQRRMMRESRERNIAIVERAEELVENGYKVMVDVSRIDHGLHLANMLDTEFVYGETDSEDRQRILDEFKSGDRDVIVSTLLDEGVDIPQLNAIILADSGKSSIKSVQTIGRALRPSNGDHAKIVNMDDSNAGEYMKEHFEAREQTMEEYYGQYYQNGASHE